MRDLAALLSELTSTPWAIRSETLDALAVLMARPGALNTALERAADPQAAVHKATENAVARKRGAVAYVPVKGTISNSMSLMDWLMDRANASPQRITGAVRAAVADDSVKAVVMDFDSPGGSVFGVAEAADAIRAMRGKKPIVAQVTGQCCSAAYHLASAADDIVAAPSSMVGSIGVYMLHIDWSGYNEQVGLKMTYVHSGKYKVEGNEDSPLDKEALAHLQQMSDDYYKLFVDGVAAGRGVSAAQVRGETFGQGRTYIAARALERTMVDKVRTLDDTLAAYGVANGPAAGGRRTAVALARARYGLNV